MSLTFNAETHRYRLDGKQVPSVTGLLSRGLPKEALVRWAARSVAEYVADNPDAVDALRFMGRDSMVAALKAVPDDTSKRAAIRGTDVHAIAEQIIHGHEVDVPVHLIDHVAGYVRFLDGFGVVPILTEKSVAHRGLHYAGRFDLIAQIGMDIWFLDNKTSRSVYPETALQLSAYAGAEFYVTDDEPDTEHPLPAVDRYGVLHVTEDGTTLVEMAPAWDEWCAVLAVAKARKAIEAKKLREITTLEELECPA